jgi:hypothetical protein
MSAVGLGDVATCGKMKCGNLDINASGKIVCDEIVTAGGNMTLNPAGSLVVQASSTTLSGGELICGTIKAVSLPTSSAGLSSGDVWNNSGVLNIVP